MIPIVHDLEPREFTLFRQSKQILNVPDFDSLEFLPIKLIIKEQLLQLQGGKCIYCERTFIDLSCFQVEHIKPKSGNNAHANLCFDYNNYAASCIQEESKRTRTCGQNKKDNLLYVEPTNPQCNDYYTLNTEGEINPLSTGTRRERHNLKATLDILGLNKAHLVRLRKKRIDALIQLMKINPSLAIKFIESGNFHFILKRLVQQP